MLGLTDDVQPVSLGSCADDDLVCQIIDGKLSTVIFTAITAREDFGWMDDVQVFRVGVVFRDKKDSGYAKGILAEMHRSLHGGKGGSTFSPELGLAVDQWHESQEQIASLKQTNEEIKQALCKLMHMIRLEGHYSHIECEYEKLHHKFELERV